MRHQQPRQRQEDSSSTSVVYLDSGAAEGLAQEEQQQQEADEAARLGWDLCLHPKRLNDAYWREQARKFMQWDTQVGF